jgi:hypothetical protein
MNSFMKLTCVLFVSISVSACSSVKTEQTSIKKEDQEKTESFEQSEIEIIDNNGQVIKDNVNNEVTKLAAKQSGFEETSQVSISAKDAEALVRDYLGLQENDRLHVEVDHEEGNKYVVHVYEVVSHEDISHTATYGWYYVYKDSAKIEEMM